MGTTLKNGAGSVRSCVTLWRVGAILVLVSLVTHVGLAPRPSEARGFSPELGSSFRGSGLQGVNDYSILLLSERASSSMVGTIMALLATFDEAGILPPEGTAQANQVIHGLIQLQSVLMKSPAPELAAYRDAADVSWNRQHGKREDVQLSEEGLTERVLAVLIAYDREHPLLEDPTIASAFRVFNLTHPDWVLIVELYNKADTVFREQGRSIHLVYNNFRMTMPGGKP